MLAMLKFAGYTIFIGTGRTHIFSRFSKLTPAHTGLAEFAVYSGYDTPAANTLPRQADGTIADVRVVNRTACEGSVCRNENERCGEPLKCTACGGYNGPGC
jgi:hypothetical protein